MTTTRRIVTVVCTVIALTATTAGSALAGQFNVNRNGSYVQVPPASTQPALGSAGAVAPTIVRVTPASGFNWGDAGIGAAAGLAIAVLIAGSGVALTQRRTDGRMRHA